MKFLSILILLFTTSLYLHAQSFVGSNIDASFASNSVYAADLNSDGFNDIIATSLLGESVNWYENNGDGTFLTHELVSIPGLGPRDAKASDINGDGKLDIILVSDRNSTLYWFENDGLGNFTQHIINTNLSNTNTVVATDMDNDTDIDLVTSSYGLFGSTGLTNFFENDGVGNFSNHEVLNQTTLLFASYPINISSNLRKDVVIAHTEGNKIRHFQHNVNSSFTEQAEIDASTDSVSSLYVIDLDQDGDSDILSASQDNDATVRWHENINQNFTTHTIATGSNGGEYVFATDLDLDGDIDIIATNPVTDSIVVHTNNGSEQFSAIRINAGSTLQVISPFAVDLDNNGSLDIVSSSDDGVILHLNDLTDVIFKNGFK